jgi:hypothetical protein
MAHDGVLAHGPALPKKTLPPMADTRCRDESDRDMMGCPF